MVNVVTALTLLLPFGVQVLQALTDDEITAASEEDCYPNAVTLDFYETCRVLENNLGGEGPESDESEMIRYANVGIFDGENFDMTVELKYGSSYVPNDSSNNGLNGKFGIINL
jgi:hypothetical protein